jgi:hypothetical protein
MTTLTEPQKQTLRTWLQQGLSLAEIQKRLAGELGVHLTYLELKLAVSELDVLPKDREPVAPPELPKTLAADAPAKGPAAPKAAPSRESAPAAPPPPAPGKVSVTVDQIARPGALASGQVRFSDGKQAAWYFDELGRLGLVPPEPGYRPPAGDIPAFQAALDRELSRLGL